MKPTDLNASTVDFYLKLLSGLSLEMKLDLISRLVSSLKSNIKKKKIPIKQEGKSILDFYGAIESEKTAEEMVEVMRSSRIFTRQIEPL